MSMFSRANHITITGGNITNVSNTGASVSPQNGIVGVLHSRSATAGLVDAKERFDAPKCAEGTRTSMILSMKKFVQDGDVDSSPALYWLHGPAGVGKSALAQSLSLLLQNEGDHAASFFFSRTSSGRSDGNKLIVTLAYQLAVNIPALQPFISKVVETNPGILTASNSAQMKSLIVDPINKWRLKYNWGIRLWTDWFFNMKPHPQLILVDGLDECNDPNVQIDLILCIASAVRQLSTPLRFIVISRPESHILTTLELNSAFIGRNGVAVTKKNLGNDEDADEQITTFLVKEFAEIRRTHPIRDFLPQQWPHLDQIGQLVAKSSKGFIYAATVIRYIKMLHNRPDECLDRILGLSGIPMSDKPYERLDVLYRHTFESVPEANRRSIHNIFHFFVSPRIWDGSTDPVVIEKELGYPPGHVQHVLRDLLCLLDFTRTGHIKILHASLPDFLLDKSRSGPLYIDVGDVHATAAASYLSKICSTNELPSYAGGFPEFLDNMMQANMSNALLRRRIPQMKLLPRFVGQCNPISIISYASDPSDSSLSMFVNEVRLVRQRLRGMSFTMAYLLVLVIQYGPENYIIDQIAAIKTYVLELYPAAGNVDLMNEQIIPVLTLIFRSWTRHDHECVQRIFSCKVTPSQTRLREAVFELYCLMGAQFYREVIESVNLSRTRGQPEHQTRQRMRRGPDFWANIVHGIDNSSNLIPAAPEPT